MSADETEEALLDPETRVLKQITVNDAEATEKMITELMGKDSDKKKKFIEENSGKAEIYV